MSTEKWYFYQDKGKTTGPIEYGELEAMISRGTLGPFDLIYRDGDDKWCPSGQLPEFKDKFKQNAQRTKEEMWVVLVRSESSNGVSYLQRGPYAESQVKALLKSGEIQYRDFIWKEGQKQWNRISSLEVFNPAPVQWKPNVEFPQDVQFQEKITREEIEKNVQYRTHNDSSVEEKPPEADGDDLAEGSAPPVLTRKLPRSPAHTGTNSHFRAGTKTGATLTRPVPVVGIEKAPKFQWLRIAGALGLAGVILFVYLFREDIFKNAKTEDVVTEEDRLAPAPLNIKKSSQRVADTPTESPVKVQESPPKVAEPIKAAVFEKVRPSFMTASHNADALKIEIKTDGSMHYPIRVKIVGEAGEVLGQVSVFREFVVDRPQNEAPLIDLKSLDLGEGPYRAYIKLEQFDAQVSFRLGGRGNEFRTKLNHHRKLISLPFQRERRRLIMATHRFVEILEKLSMIYKLPEVSRRSGLERWQNDYSDWSREQLNTVSIKNPKALVFPEQWLDLEQLASEASSIEKDGLEKVQQVVKRAKALESLAQGLSLFK